MEKIWKHEAWLNAITTLFIVLAGLIPNYSFIVFISAVIAESVIAILIAVFAVKDLHKVNASYESQRDEAYSSDDDEYWIWGMFYNNPHDKRTLVEKRYGIGSTTNFATKSGKISVWIVLPLALMLVLTCIWLIMADFTPMNIYIKNEAVVCHHLYDSYTISKEDISEVELLSALPENRSKLSGTGTDEVEKGKYTCKDYGIYYTFVRCNNSSFIRIKAKSGQTYIISGMTDSETIALYNQISK